MRKYTESLCDGQVDVPESFRISDLLNLLNIPHDDQHNILIFKNGKHVDLNTILSEGDMIVFFPPLEGG